MEYHCWRVSGMASALRAARNRSGRCVPNRTIGTGRMLQQEGQRDVAALRIIQGGQPVQRLVQFGKAAGVIRLR